MAERSTALTRRCREILCIDVQSLADVQCSLESQVGAQDATLTQLVAFHPERDLAPLLLGAASYSLKAGRGTTVLYDLEAIERQVEDKLVRGRPRLDASQVGRFL